ncbi:hypothetical protein V5299_15250 [Celeribacter halophilus]
MIQVQDTTSALREPKSHRKDLRLKPSVLDAIERASLAVGMDAAPLSHRSHIMPRRTSKLPSTGASCPLKRLMLLRTLSTNPPSKMPRWPICSLNDVS